MNKKYYEFMILWSGKIECFYTSKKFQEIVLKLQKEREYKKKQCMNYNPIINIRWLFE